VTLVDSGLLIPTPSIANSWVGDTMRSSYSFGLRAWLVGWLWVAGACVAPFSDEESGRPDAARCDTAEDCRSGACNHSKLCTHSFCDCPGDTCSAGGEVSRDCNPGWLCVYYESIGGDIGEVFGVERDLNGGSCQAPCSAGCPEHYSCGPGAKYCSMDDFWAYPVPTLRWSGAVTGELSGREKDVQVKVEYGRSVMLDAEASSPVESSIVAYEWTLTSGSQPELKVEGRSATFMLEEIDQYGRAALHVRDSDDRSGAISVGFTGCQGTGKACGYQGSGCCTGCDAAGKSCL